MDTERYNWNDESPYNIYKGRDNNMEGEYNYENPILLILQKIMIVRCI